MTLKIGINGFGRIGRAVLRATLQKENQDIKIVHINDLSEPKAISHLLKYDSVHGTLKQDVQITNGMLRVGDQEISISSSPSPSEIPWAEKGVDIVFECTGVFRSKTKALEHMKGGAKKVLISAPGENEDLTVVFGVNDHLLKSDHFVVSNGSCTTNCLAPVCKVIEEHIGIKSGLMTTVHSYTNDQVVLDVEHKDLRRSRAAALNMIPTSTGAAKAIGLVLPSLKGKIDGLAIRVPTPNVSIVDVTLELNKPTTVTEVQEMLKAASEKELKGILGYTMEPLVSTDFNGCKLSSVVDGSSIKLVNDNLLKILAWYDNETGFSWRMLDVARLMK